VKIEERKEREEERGSMRGGGWQHYSAGSPQYNHRENQGGAISREEREREQAGSIDRPMRRRHICTPAQSS